jgi:hypothetical protein
VWSLTTSQYLNLGSTRSTEVIDSDGIFLHVDLFAEAIFHEEALFAGQEALKDAILNPDSVSS